MIILFFKLIILFHKNKLNIIISDKFTVYFDLFVLYFIKNSSLCY